MFDGCDIWQHHDIVVVINMMLLVWPLDACQKKKDWQVVTLGVVVGITFGYGKNLLKIWRAQELNMAILHHFIVCSFLYYRKK